MRCYLKYASLNFEGPYFCFSYFHFALLIAKKWLKLLNATVVCPPLLFWAVSCLVGRDNLALDATITC